MRVSSHALFNTVAKYWISNAGGVSVTVCQHFLEVQHNYILTQFLSVIY